MNRPAFIFLSPNLEKDDVALATKMIWRGAVGGEAEAAEEWLEKYLGRGVTAVGFNAGRSALWAILKAAGVGAGDEVVVQAFTCVAVTNSIRWLGGRPVFADIEKNTLNMSPESLRARITQKTKVVVVQHTFGRMADVEKIGRICREYKIVMIEDCAHALGAEYRGQKAGTFGDGAIFSFGRDKVLSSVFGGVAVAREAGLAGKLKQVGGEVAKPDDDWVRQQLWHPVVTWAVLVTYRSGVGKLLHKLARAAGLVSPEVYPEEKKGGQPEVFPRKFDDRLAALALRQLGKLERFNKRRAELAKIYGEKWGKGAVYMVIPRWVNNREEVLAKAEEQGWRWGDWYRQVVMPAADNSVTGYVPGSCPAAEEAAEKIINLPTCPYLADRQVKEIAEKFELWSK